ncbi:MAG TPA: glycosyltransferase [Vicinamibacterales bacterium]|nr:glycosyltransferase [Vicinamibacterales bacterium]
MNAIPTVAPSAAHDVNGKFLRVNDARFLIRGVSYGTFAPRHDGLPLPERSQVRRDCALMVRAGINAIRTYTVPPPDVLDVAAEYGLRVLAGLAWPQHVAFLDDRRLRRDIIRSIGTQARAVANHPALLLIAIGNEIPPSVVRWHGAREVERFVGAAVDAARTAAPHVPLTYVNYPPTEFLELPFLDVCAFNVYLHSEQEMRAYVGRLQHIAAGRPLILTECGADSQRLGETGQAALTAMQARVAFSEGAAGVVVFGWTDEWWRNDVPVVDWSFGLVDRLRRPKAAYSAVASTFQTAPFTEEQRERWPGVSIVVCAYNAATTIDDCLTALEQVDYPSFEVIVVDDGSTDDTASRVRGHRRARLIEIANGGLSAARNVGLRAAQHEIVAYVDADVRVDPCWLAYLVQPFATSDVVAVGGPNVVPPDDSWFAHCVARAPGAPSHVLIDDRIADHVPGCNLAVRRDALLAIGGFDPIFLRAGDDVDVCWRLQARGGRIAFSPAALVWHHHRSSLAAYWRQQVGYGEGEAWLRLRHRHRFSGSGVMWRGRIYSALPFIRSMSRRQVHSGVWGTAAFPTVYYAGTRPLQALPHTAEWQIGAALLGVLGLMSYLLRGDTASALVMVAGLAGLGVTVGKCVTYAWRSELSRVPVTSPGGRIVRRFHYRAAIAWLHVVQPLARSYGYLRGTLQPPSAPVTTVPEAPTLEAVPRRRRAELSVLLGRPARRTFWSEVWTTADALLARTVERLRARRVGHRIQVDDGWRADRDLSVALGSWAWAHVRTLVEDHGTGRCLLRVRLDVRLRVSAVALVGALVSAVLLARAYGGRSIMVAVVGCAILILAKLARDLSRDLGQILDVITAVADDFGMQSVGDVQPPRFKAAVSRWRRLSATHGG